MNRNQKRLALTIKCLRTSLEKDDIADFSSIFLANESPLTLRSIREQKILLLTSPKSLEPVSALLKYSSQRLLRPVEAKHFENYLSFLKHYKNTRNELQVKLSAVLHSFPKINFEELTDIASETLRRQLKSLPWLAPKSSQTVADYERRLQDLNTHAGDIVYAILRGMNETSKLALDINSINLSRSARQTAERRLLGATSISAELNGLEWVFDSVTYGELVISHITEGRTAAVHFDYADVRRTLILVLANRRNLILDHNRARAPRFVRDTLGNYETAILKSAIEYYCSLAEIDSSSIDMEKLLLASANLLIRISAEDDLLIAASKFSSRTWIYYLASIAMYWYSLAANAVKKEIPLSRRRRFSASSIPLEQIASRIAGIDRDLIDEALKSFTCTLPATSHYQLVQKPFFKQKTDFAHHIALAESGQWVISIRDALINGGTIGDSYGRIWEDFLHQSFKESDWELIGRNLKLRENGKILTDIDLLTKRDDLLLIIQIKAVVGAGLSPYDHWRNRQTIELGCRQATTAADFCRRTPQWLESVAGLIKARQIHHIQPLVLTNLNHFDGWKFENVPVIGEVGRKAITQGSKVVYSDATTGETIAVRSITKPEDLSTERILWALENPVELLISPEQPNTTYKKATVGGLHFKLPQFEIATAENDVPVILRSANDKDDWQNIS